MLSMAEKDIDNQSFFTARQPAFLDSDRLIFKT